jgi:hypothetical protein
MGITFRLAPWGIVIELRSCLYYNKLNNSVKGIEPQKRVTGQAKMPPLQEAFYNTLLNF